MLKLGRSPQVGGLVFIAGMRVPDRVDGRAIEPRAVKRLHHEAAAVHPGARRARCADHVFCAEIGSRRADHGLDMVGPGAVPIHPDRAYIRTEMVPVVFRIAHCPPGGKIDCAGHREAVVLLEGSHLVGESPAVIRAAHAGIIAAEIPDDARRFQAFVAFRQAIAPAAEGNGILNLVILRRILVKPLHLSLDIDGPAAQVGPRTARMVCIHVDEVFARFPVVVVWRNPKNPLAARSLRRIPANIVLAAAGRPHRHGNRGNGFGGTHVAQCSGKIPVIVLCLEEKDILRDLLNREGRLPYEVPVTGPIAGVYMCAVSASFQMVSDVDFRPPGTAVYAFRGVPYDIVLPVFISPNRH